MYLAVVRPVLSYRCAVWHMPEGVKGARKMATKPLEGIQNKALRAITGAYKTTEVQVMEHEAGIAPLMIHLDELAITHTIRYRTGDAERVITEECSRIRRIARAQYGAKGNPGPPRRMRVRAATAAIVGPMDTTKPDKERTEEEREQVQAAYNEAWKRRWEKQLQQERRNRSTAKATPWNPGTRFLHAHLNKAQSTIATLIRTENIGLADYLYRRRIPGYDSPACSCGWQRQTPKHILLFCPKWEDGREAMIADAKTEDYKLITTTATGLWAATRWFLQTEILRQFSIAKEMQEEDEAGCITQVGTKGGGIREGTNTMSL